MSISDDILAFVKRASSQEFAEQYNYEGSGSADDELKRLAANLESSLKQLVAAEIEAHAQRNVTVPPL